MMAAPIRPSPRFEDVRRALSVPDPTLHHLVETNFPLSQPILHLSHEFSELSELENKLEESQSHPTRVKIVALCATIFMIIWIVACIYTAKYGGALAKGGAPILLFFGTSLMGAWFQKKFLGKYTPIEHLGPIVWALSGPFVPLYSLQRREGRFQELIQEKKETLNREITTIQREIQRNEKHLKEQFNRYVETLDHELIEARRPDSPIHAKEGSLQTAREALNSIKEALPF